jgi:hypothetical protein
MIAGAMGVRRRVGFEARSLVREGGRLGQARIAADRDGVVEPGEACLMLAGRARERGRIEHDHRLTDPVARWGAARLSSPLDDSAWVGVPAAAVTPLRSRGSRG